MTFSDKAFMIKRRFIIILCFALIAIYIVSYCILSAMGNYHWDQSGLIRYEYGSGLAVSDIELWRPAFAWYQNNYKNIDGEFTSRGNALGYFYSPLIILDRKIFHKTTSFMK